VSETNVELVRRIYESINRQDWDAAFRDVDEGLVMETKRAGTFRGRDEVRRFVEDQFAPFDSLSTEPEETFDGGDQVVAFVRIRARPADSTAEIEVRIGHLWTIEDGMAVSLRTFPRREEALEAMRAAAG
jgi:ketosteroid isomerase-like protein